MPIKKERKKEYAPEDETFKIIFDFEIQNRLVNPEGIRLASIQDSIGASIQRLEDKSV